MPNDVLKPFCIVDTASELFDEVGCRIGPDRESSLRPSEPSVCEAAFARCTGISISGCGKRTVISFRSSFGKERFFLNDFWRPSKDSKSVSDLQHSFESLFFHFFTIGS